MSSTPRVGDPVHYVSYGTPHGEYDSTCRAAIITEKIGPDGLVGVAVLNPTGMFFNRVTYSAIPAAGTWHHPCADR